jgi:hypothetical protein
LWNLVQLNSPPAADRAGGRGRSLTSRPSSPNRVDALVWGITELAIPPMKSFGIYELYRQLAAEQTTRETALIAAPDPVQQRQDAILTERQRYAALMADRLPTPAESAAHVATFSRRFCRRAPSTEALRGALRSLVRERLLSMVAVMWLKAMAAGSNVWRFSRTQYLVHAGDAFRHLR